MDNEWEAGTTPWLRQHQTSAGWGPETDPVQCMFCGAKTLKRSATDREQDTGRMELYCDNQFCDAREMVLLVRRDGADAIFRADVKALNLIDNGELDVHAAFPPEMKSVSMADLLADHGNEVERRMRKATDERS
ncbi:hypothetical protein [Streptomyces sp. NPDC005548]|uniref:hypothetical protein n=1 Tax=Streptomyces sp. NPDC005548 TaxID=3364724 RepID=UPI0036CB4898